MLTLCECGCGLPAPIAPKTNTYRGWVKGQPLRFVKGHQRLGSDARRSHGMSHTREWDSYCNAKRRCTNPNHEFWEDYGGRGIEFRFANFEEFFAELGPKPEGLTLDRINNDGHYEKGNVRWATREQQRGNRRDSRKAA